MVTDSTIEERPTAVEAAVAGLKSKLEVPPPSTNWLDQVIGIFKDEPAFDEVIRLGREFRMADRLDEDSE
jgi:hypothetical protein